MNVRLRAKPVAPVNDPGLAWLGGKLTHPYTWLLYSNMGCKVDDFSLRRACFGRYAILHLHNPEQDLNVCSTAAKAYLRLRRRFVAIDLMRLRGTKVFWTVHNLASHERRYPRLERWFWRQMPGRLDCYIALTEGGRTEAMERFPLLRTLPGLEGGAMGVRLDAPDQLSGTSVAICIPTFNRPESLARLLRGTASLEFEKIRRPQIRVIVIDNESSGSASAICQSFKGSTFFPLIYEIEPRRGISSARNRALSLCEESDFVAFIDDDEVPCANWLDSLLKTQTSTNGDVVFGPVLPHFVGPVSEWLLKGKFFERPRFNTGERVFVGRTNNVLVRRAVFEKVGKFDPQFGLTGGEDADFFERAMNAGFSMYWADEAEVSEWLPSTRTTARSLMRRSFGFGTSRVTRFSMRKSWWRPIVLVLVEGVGGMVKNLFMTGISLPLGRDRAFRWLERACWDAGIIAGGLGYRDCRYKNTDGC